MQAPDPPMSSHHDELVPTLARELEDRAERLARNPPEGDPVADASLRSFDRGGHLAFLVLACGGGQLDGRADLEAVGSLDVHGVHASAG